MSNTRHRQWPSIQNIHTIIFDFDGVFTDNKVYVGQDGMEWVRCDRGDGLAIDLLRRYRQKRALNFDFFILSTEGNPDFDARARQLRMESLQARGTNTRF